MPVLDEQRVRTCILLVKGDCRVRWHLASDLAEGISHLLQPQPGQYLRFLVWVRQREGFQVERSQGNVMNAHRYRLLASENLNHFCARQQPATGGKRSGGRTLGSGVTIVDMSQTSWNERYAAGEPLPWDTGTPDPQLVEMIESGAVRPGRTLEIGCGTGTNAIFLVQRGFDVLGVDISEVAVDTARGKANGLCRFEVVDFLSGRRPADRSSSCSIGAVFTFSMTNATEAALRRTSRRR